MKSGKRRLAERIERPNQECIKSLGEKENYKYLGMLETDTIKYAKIKEKIRVPQKNEKASQTSLFIRNLIKGINTWAVPLVRYSRPFLK